MASIRDLRNRIKSVNNIRQITRAMEMVATTKLRRFQDKAVSSRPYSQEITALVQRLAGLLGEEISNRPLFQKGSGNRVAILLVTSDRGLAGAYNSNVFRALELWLLAHPGTEVEFHVIGRKGYQYLTRRGREIHRYLVEPTLEQIDYRGATRAARALIEGFVAGKYSEVLVMFTAFESMVRYVPTTLQLLPIESVGTATERQVAATGDLILEPDAATIFDALVPRYLETRVYNALLESLTSEYASRRVSMKNATDAAKAMGTILKKVYNRKRQESITKELLDIVGGVEALK